MNAEEYTPKARALYADLRAVMRKIKDLDDEYLRTDLGAHPRNTVVEYIEGPSSAKPRRLTVRILGSTVENGEAWYTATTDLDGKKVTAVTRFIPHHAIVCVLAAVPEPPPAS